MTVFTKSYSSMLIAKYNRRNESQKIPDMYHAKREKNHNNDQF